MKNKEGKPELWISPIDKNGEPVDATLIEIAKRAWPAVIAIGRERRMYDVSWLREIMEKVVHATSMRLKKDKDVSINTGYIVTSCKNEMKRVAKEVGKIDQRSSEELDCEIDTKSIKWEARLHRDLIIDKLLAKIDQKQKNLVLLRLEGQRWKYIANTLGMSVGSARVQFSKTLKLLRDIVNNQDPGAKRNPKSQNP